MPGTHRSMCVHGKRSTARRPHANTNKHNRITNTAHTNIHAQTEAKERHADDIRKDVELASIEADKILADQVRSMVVFHSSYPSSLTHEP